MKIVFLCGSLEPGRDGVGDYTRRLAASLCKNGVCSFIISLYDKQANQIMEEGQLCDAVEVNTLRIPASENASSRIIAALRWIEKINPEWISLQFVPFSFQKKGLPFQLQHLLKELVRGRKLHIMFHELWVGIERYKSIKYWVWAQLQKRIIVRLVKLLNPSVIHTQTQFYKYRLNEQGIKARQLRLFSNIPNVTDNATKEKKLEKDQISFIVFGSIYPDSLFREFANDCANYAKDNSKEIILVIIGRAGPEKEQWALLWASLDLKVILLGEQDSERVSEELTKASVGITTTPYVLVEKSGAVAAMLDHGLPVLCIAKPLLVNKSRNVFDTPYVTQYEKGSLADHLTNERNVTSDNGLTRIAAEFLNSLEENEISQVFQTAKHK